jgi:hypothetical protein
LAAILGGLHSYAMLIAANDKLSSAFAISSERLQQIHCCWKTSPRFAFRFDGQISTTGRLNRF